MYGDRGCVTGDHLPFRGLRYPSGFPRPGDPDGVCSLSRVLQGRCSMLILHCDPGGRSARQSATGPTTSGPTAPLPFRVLLMHLPGSSCLPGLFDLLSTRETLTPEDAHVYSHHDRFSSVG